MKSTRLICSRRIYTDPQSWHDPYQLDDKHWNATGIAIAVEEILPLLDE